MKIFFYLLNYLYSQAEPKMKIEQTNSKNFFYNYKKQKNINFKAKKYATVKTLVENCTRDVLEIYKINDKDVKFLELMSYNINLRKLTERKYTRTQYRQWKTAINNAILLTGFNEPQQSFLLAKNKKPCSIITFKDLPMDTYLDYLVSWPIAINENVKLAGTTLMKNLFDYAERKNTRKITLTMSTTSHSNLLEYYTNLGFKKISARNPLSPDLEIFQSSYTQKSQELEKHIKIERLKNQEDIPLLKVMDIKY